ncbi:protein S100-A1-like [Pyxicephalus adspersus]|uniref:protein S100-A1-like n=1 Tax=Pyxicephalus adspersus TaxID=30357 RepID=UPI003B5C46A4
MSELEKAMGTINKIFHDYSYKEGDKHGLSKQGMKDLLQNELRDYAERNPGSMDKVMKEVDENKKVVLDLDSFFNLLASVLVTPARSRILTDVSEN